MRMTEKNPHALGGHKLSSGLPRPTVCDSPQDSQVSGGGGSEQLMETQKHASDRQQMSL